MIVKDIASWGRLTPCAHQLVELNNHTEISSVLNHNKPGICYGMGRSYGDVCLNQHGILWQTAKLDQFIDFDETNGLLTCQAGVLLKDIQQLMVPRGWMLPVTPGTQFVTLGGAIANDVHGKNHHVHGSFAHHVKKIKLHRTDGEIIEATPSLEAEWFAATIGGLGLTGVIVEAQIQLRPIAGSWLATETIAYNSLQEFFHLADTSEEAWEYTVAWVDCMSGKNVRGIFMRANHAASEREPRQSRKLSIPFSPPVSVFNQFTLRPLNATYFYLQKWQAGTKLAHYQSFFYPLDSLLNWNKLYGRKGFFQYQTVVPRENGYQATEEMLAEIKRARSGSLLGVLKTFGNKQPLGMLSFAQPGVTLALDFANQGKRNLKLFERLDAIVEQAGGKIYPAKDARMPAKLFAATYPRLNEFLPYRDPGIGSDMSRRLMGS